MPRAEPFYKFFFESISARMSDQMVFIDLNFCFGSTFLVFKNQLKSVDLIYNSYSVRPAP